MCDRTLTGLKEAVCREGSHPLERRTRSKRDFGREARPRWALEPDKSRAGRTPALRLDALPGCHWSLPMHVPSVPADRKSTVLPEASFLGGKAYDFLSAEICGRDEEHLGTNFQGRAFSQLFDHPQRFIN